MDWTACTARGVVYTVSTHADARAAAGRSAATADAKEAGRLLGAAGFVELTGICQDTHVAFRSRGVYNDLVMLFADGHVEAVRQWAESTLWLPGQDHPDTPVWIKTGDPLGVVHELLSLGD